MNQILLALLAANGNDQSMMPTIIMMVALFAIVYFFMIRPQNKKQKEIQKFRQALQKGDEVVTIGGAHGIISAIDEKDNTVELNMGSNIKVKFELSAIMPKGTQPAK